MVCTIVSVDDKLRLSSNFAVYKERPPAMTFPTHQLGLSTNSGILFYNLETWNTTIRGLFVLMVLL